MRDSRRTSLLLTAAVALLLVHFFPKLAAPVAWSALAAGVVWTVVMGLRLASHYRANRADAAQEAADERDYRAYKSELDALRAHHDPSQEWTESTDFPGDYRDALNELHERYRAMLERRFGST